MTQIDHSKLKAKPHQEDFAGKYENNGFIAKTLVENYFKAVKKLLQKTSNINNAHEIGAGEGRSTTILSKIVDNISASEFVEELVAKAKEMNPDVAIFQESVYDLKYENDSVDLVFLLEVLEHLDYPEKALQEIKRVSKKYLILGVPREPLWCFLNMCRLKYLRDFGNTPGHLNHWSKKKIIKLVEKEYGKVIAVESPIPWTILLAIKEE
jgi:ubiquinone/menaquinone biosynthesis C-methylase UbiE